MQHYNLKKSKCGRRVWHHDCSEVSFDQWGEAEPSTSLAGNQILLFFLFSVSFLFPLFLPIFSFLFFLLNTYRHFFLSCSCILLEHMYQNGVLGLCEHIPFLFSNVRYLYMLIMILVILVTKMKLSQSSMVARVASKVAAALYGLHYSEMMVVRMVMCIYGSVSAGREFWLFCVTSF